MEYNFEINGQEVTITDSQDVLKLSELFESDIIEDKPVEVVNELQALHEFGF